MHAQLPPLSVAPHAWETIVDAEQVFSVSMPRGWRNRAWFKSNGPMPHQLATAESPSGETALFLGDPTLPQFIEPSAVVFAPPLPGRGDAVIVVVNRKGEGVDTARIVARLAEATFGLELRALGEEG